MSEYVRTAVAPFFLLFARFLFVRCFLWGFSVKTAISPSSGSFWILTEVHEINFYLSFGVLKKTCIDLVLSILS